MSDVRTSDLMARYGAPAEKSWIKGAGGLACIAFTTLLGCAFWAGAVIASTPLPH